MFSFKTVIFFIHVLCVLGAFFYRLCRTGHCSVNPTHTYRIYRQKEKDTEMRHTRMIIALGHFIKDYRYFFTFYFKAWLMLGVVRNMKTHFKYFSKFFVFSVDTLSFFFLFSGFAMLVSNFQLNRKMSPQKHYYIEYLFQQSVHSNSCAIWVIKWDNGSLASVIMI